LPEKEYADVCWVWWYMPVIPATQEAGIVGLRSKAGQYKSGRPYLKNKLQAKGLGAWLKW
jgi:hypothetical protein